MKSFIFKHVISKFYKLFFSIDTNPKKFDVQNNKCLLLTTHVEDALCACGGLLLKNNKNFDIKCLTNGFKSIIDVSLTYEEKVQIRRKEFDEIVENLKPNDARFFNDIDDNRLIMRYDRFKSIDLANYDYIFIPNILEPNRDNKAISVLLNQLLKDEKYKNNLKIVMYEINSAISIPNLSVDISDIIEEKTKLINKCKTMTAGENYSDIVKGLNRFRGMGIHKQYAEAYCLLSVKDFKDICKVYYL